MSRPYTEEVVLIADDTQPNLTFRIFDKAVQTAFDLSQVPGATVELRFKGRGASTLTTTVPVTIDDPEEGMVTIVWGVNLVGLSAGAYEGEVRITGDSGFRRTVPTLIAFAVEEPI